MTDEPAPTFHATRSGLQRMRVAVAVLAAMLVMAAVGAVLMYRRVAALDAELLRTRATWQAGCATSRFAALGEIHRTVLAAQTATTDSSKGGVPGSPGAGVSAYIFACTMDHTDTKTQSMAKVISDLAFFLRLDENYKALESLERELDERPLELWKAMPMPSAKALKQADGDWSAALSQTATAGSD